MDLILALILGCAIIAPLDGYIAVAFGVVLVNRIDTMTPTEILSYSIGTLAIVFITKLPTILMKVRR